MKHSRNYGLDLLRAIAIALVIASHFSQGLQILGVMGVELFFVLSGYLIGGIFLHQILSVPHFQWRHLYTFLRRRWLRTIPNYYLFLLIHLALSSVLGGATFYGFLKYVVFFQNFAWPIGIFYPISWSLAVEEWFYLLFPALVFILLQFVSKKRAFLAAMLFMIVVPLAVRIHMAPSAAWEAGIRMVVTCRLDALMFGVALAFVKSSFADVWPRLKWLFVPGFLLAVVNLMVLRKIPDSSPAPHAALIFSLLPLASAFMLPGIERLGRPKNFTSQWVESISKWSYSIYLSHPAILFTAYYLTNSSHLSSGGKLGVKAFALGCVIIVSKLVYENFEVPITNLRDRLERAPQGGTS